MADAEFDAIIQEMKKAFISGDIEGMMSRYDDDMSYASNMGDIVKGKDKIRESTAGFMVHYATVDFSPLDRVICGDWCTEMGTFTSKKKDGTDEKGKYMVGYVKKDGRWLMRFHGTFFC